MSNHNLPKTFASQSLVSSQGVSAYTNSMYEHKKLKEQSKKKLNLLYDNIKKVLLISVSN